MTEIAGVLTNTIRWVLVTVAVVAAVATYAESPTRAGVFILGAALLSIGYFRHGTVWLAFQAQRKGGTERANVADLRTDNDRSMATTLCAVAALSLGDRERAQRHVLAAKKYPRRQEITTLLQKVEQDIAGPA